MRPSDNKWLPPLLQQQQSSSPGPVAQPAVAPQTPTPVQAAAPSTGGAPDLLDQIRAAIASSTPGKTPAAPTTPKN